jgi:single-strand DNA-binding protein
VATPLQCYRFRKRIPVPDFLKNITHLFKTTFIKTKKTTHIMNNLSNNVQLIGHLGRNPEVKTLDNGTKVVKMLLATNEYRKNEHGEKATHTTWHNLTAWGNTASIAERFLIKGKHVCINGKLANNTYTDKNGIKRYATEIVVNNIEMIA